MHRPTRRTLQSYKSLYTQPNTTSPTLHNIPRHVSYTTPPLTKQGDDGEGAGREHVLLVADHARVAASLLEQEVHRVAA